jgi:hypothetical protein
LFRKHFRAETGSIEPLPTNSINQHMEFDRPDMPPTVAKMQQGGRNAPNVDLAATDAAADSTTAAAAVSRRPGCDPVCQANRWRGSSGPASGGKIIHSA